MANPKRKHSRARTGSRRAHDALEPITIPLFERLRSAKGGRSKRYICSHCKQIKMPHSICGNCGYYRGKQVVAIQRV
ncbi:MAG: 50S ribosomal protein L32 [Candidatus Brocadiales bacterium]